MSKAMETLEKALQELLCEAGTALAALEKIAKTCPSVLKEYSVSGDIWRTFYYTKWTKSRGGRWVGVPDVFATFALAEDGAVERYEWGQNVGNPGGLLAAMLRKEKEKLASVAKLSDVVPTEAEEE